MARAAGTYSRIVAGLKVLLPFLALALLSTLFLFARSTDPTRNLPMSTAEDLRDRQSQSATGAVYTGVADNGAEVTMRAEMTRPDPDATNNLLADRFGATLDFPDGSRIDLSAPSAAMDNSAAATRLTGGVVIESSTGYTVRTETLNSAMDRIDVESDGTVEADGPAGRLTAGKMRILPAETETGEEGDVQLLFTDGVQMVYEPQQQD